MPSSGTGTAPAPSSTFRGTLRPAPSVAEVVRGDATVLADFRGGRYYTLSPVSGRIWALLREGHTLPALLARLHEEYDAPAERIDADAVAFVETLRASGLVTWEAEADAAFSRRGDARDRDVNEGEGAAPERDAASSAPSAGRSAVGRSFRAPSALHCGLLILAVKLSLRLTGFARTWRWIRRRTARISARDDVPPADIAATEYRVALAAALWPGRALCLEQSLVLYYVLRRAGISAELRMGVQPHPFLAHAWVEYRGAPVNDFPEHIAQLHPMEALPL